MILSVGADWRQEMEEELDEKHENLEKETGKVAVIAYANGHTPTDGGFFSIHRRGQGKWTRLGTALASSLIIGGTGLFIYYDLGPNVKASDATMLTIAGVFILVAGILAFWLQNKAGNVAFLIDTDSEMKKVNWTSRQELIGSTKVVIAFMFIMAFGLFVVDIFFGYLFYYLGVLKVSPGFIEGFEQVLRSKTWGWAVYPAIAVLLLVGGYSLANWFKRDK